MVNIKGGFPKFDSERIDISPKPNKWIGDIGGESPATGDGSPEASFLFTNNNIEERLNQLIESRHDKLLMQFSHDTWRFPVGFFFTRDRVAGAAAKEVQEEMFSGFKYWDDDSGEHFDIFFPGWILGEAKPKFDEELFIERKNEIESLSKWRYSGETDFLLLNFQFDPLTAKGKLCFDEVIVLLVEEMIREKHIGSFAALLRLTQDAAKAVSKPGKSNPVWEMSDKMGFTKGKQSLWDALKKLILKDLAQVYDNTRPYAVVNLSKKP